MSIETITMDAAAHFGAGITFSLIDYVSYRIANPKDKRIEDKNDCLRSIEILLDSNIVDIKTIDGTAISTEQNSIAVVNAQSALTDNISTGQRLDKESMQYALNVETVKNYLRNNGMVKMQLPLWQRIKDGVRGIIYQEKINNLSNGQKLGLAIALEVGYDTLFGYNYYTQVLKHSPIAAVSTNLYQIPIFFAGLWTGNYIKKTANWVLTSSEEKNLDKTIKKLLKETPIVDLVIQYQLPENVQLDLEEQGTKVYGPRLTRAGKHMFKGIKEYTGALIEGTKDAAGAVMHYGERKAAQEQKYVEDRKERFDRLTKGY